MKQKFLGAAIAAAFGLCGAASAQFQTPYSGEPHGVTIRGGIAFPFDSHLRDISKTFIGAGLEYSLTHEWIPNSTTFLSVDWFGKNANGQKGNVFPLAINQRFYTGKSVRKLNDTRAYWFVGVGYTFVDVTSSFNKPSARGGVGADIGPNFVLEAAGYVSGKGPDGVSANAIGIYAGYRFR